MYFKLEAHSKDELWCPTTLRADADTCWTMIVSSSNFLPPAQSAEFKSLYESTFRVSLSFSNSILAKAIINTELKATREGSIHRSTNKNKVDERASRTIQDQRLICLTRVVILVNNLQIIAYFKRRNNKTGDDCLLENITLVATLRRCKEM